MTRTLDESEPPLEQRDLRYSLLSDNGCEIRILTIFPGNWADNIECKLSTASLDDPALVYHGLSYAWGHHSDLSTIAVNGQAVTITPSLESALRHVRQEDQSLALWIDKLCINQDDELEKSHQVALMHRIFQRCSNVLIWLGPAEPPVEAAEKHELLRRWSTRSGLATETGLWNVCGCCNGRRKKRSTYDKLLLCEEQHVSEDPFAMIMHFAQDHHISDLPCFFRNIFGQLYFTETPQFRSMWLIFRQLLSTTWHWRLWCVQEALLASNAWVMYGSWRIPFSTIRKSLQNQRRHLFTCCSKVEKLFPSTYAFCPDTVYTQPAPTGDLDTLLRMYRYKDCRNPRDKVYGILALLDTGDTLEVDYAKSVRDVYTEAMSLIIQNCRGDLRCLTGQGFSSSAHDLPSWVRNLANRPSIESVHAEMRRLEAYDLYNACNGMEGPAIRLENDQLQFSGIFVDTIAQVCTPLDIPIEQCDARYVLRVLLSWRQAAIQAGHDVSLLWPDVLKQEAFWRTIIGDLVFQSESMSYRRYTSEDAEPYSAWLRQLLLQSVLFMRPTLDDGFVQAMLCACFGRAMFVTEKGHLGLCYSGARIGDEVWVLNGGRVPFVLRKADTQEEAHRYKLVGDCHLHGFMDGEALAGAERSVQTMTIC